MYKSKEILLGNRIVYCKLQNWKENNTLLLIRMRYFFSEADNQPLEGAPSSLNL